MIFMWINLGIDIVIAVLLIFVFVLLTFFTNRGMKKHETLPKGYIWFYVLDVLYLIGAIGFILWMFGFDYQTAWNDIWTSIQGGFLAKVGALIGTAATIMVTMLIVRITSILTRRAGDKAKLNKKRVLTILKVTQSIVKYVVEIVALLVILSFWGVNVMPALAGLGILGIIIGMGTQSLIKDFISGFFIIFEHHFDVGDIVEINGFKGEVIDVGLKSTKIKNWKQDIMIFANGTIENTINYTLSPSIAIIDFGIAYKEDIQKTMDILKEDLPRYKEIFPEIIEDPVCVGVIALADSSVNLRVICKTETEKHYAVERFIRQGIKELLDKNNIEIPFPQVTVHKAEE
ncbi:MAG: mechanosensitive ion channel family protein [Bacilli bacterium]|nr:mechanosensitive ion channel family protein [Bacilli bacterium]MBN2876541.1 mechanosensitive ion channel family protein [Bacilli bacterium]